MRVGLAELLQEAAKKRAKKDKIALLHEGVKTPHFFSMLKYVFKDSILWDLPEGAPPFKKQPKESDLQNVLFSEFRRLKIFMKGEYPDMRAIKRETLFIEFLESLDPDDADLIVAMKDKKLPFKGLTKKTVCEAFPKDTVGW
mgnify:CR=1 FL=1|jgi:hypothetical protein|tara:strand:+ start:2197 stop:2622 length:426 start_codon:yes stop_codon:yes gene_type:complete